MFLETKEAGEVQAPAKVMRLSEAIRIGCAWVRENSIYSGCAIGTGYRALTGRDLTEDWDKSDKKAEELVAEAFGVPYAHVAYISVRHFAEDMTREQCADYLESLGH